MGKKEKKPHRGQKWVGRNEWVSWTYNLGKYFLPYFSRFEMRPLFTPNFWGEFWIIKPKSRDLIASKFGTNMQINNLKLLSKFHVARPNRSRVMSKSLKLHTHWFENGPVKTKERATRASVVPITE